jgi:hypothetical protein
MAEMDSFFGRIALVEDPHPHGGQMRMPHVVVDLDGT